MRNYRRRTFIDRTLAQTEPTVVRNENDEQTLRRNIILTFYFFKSQCAKVSITSCTKFTIAVRTNEITAVPIKNNKKRNDYTYLRRVIISRETKSAPNGN